MAASWQRRREATEFIPAAGSGFRNYGDENRGRAECGACECNAAGGEGEGGRIPWQLAGGETLSSDEKEARTNSPRCLSRTKTSFLEAFFQEQ